MRVKAVKTFVLWAAVCVLTTSLDVCAQTVDVNGELKGFWQKGDAANWTAPVQENSSTAVVYRDYPLAVDKIKEETRAAVATQANQQSDKNPQHSEQKAAPAQPLTRDQIVAKYGAPDSPRAIRAQKDSPPEMQGLFEAINSGDKDLAWQYSLALARRNAEIHKTVTKATDYQVLAMEALGIRPTTESEVAADSVNPNRLELQEFIARTKAEQAKAKVDVDKQLEQMDAWSEQPAGQAQLARAVSQPASASVDGRAQTQEAQIPVDPAGRVKVLVFFDERGAEAQQLSAALRPLKERFKDDASVSIIGLTKRTYALPGLKTLGATTNFPFPLLNGEALAQELRIHTYPAVVFVATTSKQTYRLDGVPAAQEVERIVTLMKGSR